MLKSKEVMNGTNAVVIERRHIDLECDRVICEYSHAVGEYAVWTTRQDKPLDGFWGHYNSTLENAMKCYLA